MPVIVTVLPPETTAFKANRALSTHGGGADGATKMA
jgi:hypothetical protein